MKKQELTYDILRELFNISVGKAAEMLSEIINKKILLNVPDIEVIDIRNKEIQLDNYISKVIDGTLMVSSISFEKKIKGKANLIFPMKKMRKFINLCVDEENSLEMDFTDIDFDVIKEIGNIILNCIVGEVGNYLAIDLTYTLPEVKVFDKIHFGKHIVNNNEYANILLLYITFVIDDTEIQGAVVIDLTLNSLNELIKKIDEIRDEIDEEAFI